MSIESAFEQVPPNATEFRYEDGFFRFLKRKDGSPNVIARNIHSEYHLHLYMKEGQLYGRIAKEVKGATKKPHGKEFLMLDLLRPFTEPVGELLSHVETVSIYDRRFSGRKVQTVSFHRFRYEQTTRKKVSHIEPDLEYREYRFENIDLDLPQIGVLKGWLGKETALVFVGRGEVHILHMKYVKRCAKQLEHELEKFDGFDKLYPE